MLIRRKEYEKLKEENQKLKKITETYNSINGGDMEDRILFADKKYFINGVFIENKLFYPIDRIDDVINIIKERYNIEEDFTNYREFINILENLKKGL